MFKEMARTRRGFCRLHDGRDIKFLLQKRARDPFFLVRFAGPDGRTKERSTKESALERARQAARALIDIEYNEEDAARRTAPGRPPKVALDWNDALALLTLHMRAAGLASGTIEQYAIAVRQLHRLAPATSGPAEVTREMAEDFKRCRLKTGGSAATVSSNLMTLSTVYSRWWGGECGILSFDPFAGLKVSDSSRTSEHKSARVKMRRSLAIAPEQETAK